jgi:hypothetical protein
VRYDAGVRPLLLAALGASLLVACAPAVPGPVLVEAAAPEPPAEAPLAALRSPLPASIDLLERLLGATPDTASDRPRLLRRLAEEYAQAEAVAQQDPSPAAPARAAAARARAIALYDELRRRHPDFCTPGGGCGDEVLFFLAHEHEAANQPEEARRARLELIKRFPLSRYLPDVYLAFADRLFDEASRDPSKLVLAGQAYDKVLSYPGPENRVLAYAHYKRGWVAYNLDDPARAVAELAAAASVASSASGAAKQAALARAAAKDLAMMCEVLASKSSWATPPPACVQGAP